jgi:hypothetical protein
MEQETKTLAAMVSVWPIQLQISSTLPNGTIKRAYVIYAASSTRGKGVFWFKTTTIFV